MRSRFTNHALILGYHRIADEQRDPYSLCVNLQQFGEHMEVLNELANPIHLDQLAQFLKSGRIPPRTVAVTFDDGYADNLYHGKPILEQCQVPATVFVVSGYMGKEFWWDELENVLLAPSTLPAKLRFSLGGISFRYPPNSPDPSIPVDGDYQTRTDLLQILYKKMLPLPVEVRREVIDYLSDWANIKPEASSACRVMTADELVQLSSGGLVDIGAHSVTHPLLSGLEADAQRAEILQSKETVEKILGHNLKSFSFPHGLPSEETRDLVRDAGFICACSSFNDIAWRGSDPFNLPRFWPQNWNENKFKKWLQRWLAL
jgi:peptidoglycan/xylan/chitin deacetylase (PgdA/CDA1 family)